MRVLTHERLECYLETQREDELGSIGVRGPVTLTIPGHGPVCVSGHCPEHQGGNTESKRNQGASVGQDH